MARKYLNDLTADELREHVNYDPLTGIFKSRKHGGVIGSNGKYVVVYVAGRSYLGHRLAWLYVCGEWPTNQIDHIDGNTRNNQISNLREASDIENHQNTKCLGYHYHARAKGYCAQIKINKRQKYLGTFKTADAARAAYEAASIKYFGEFSAILSRGAP